MPSPETNLIRRILKRHGARPDLRLWRNETGTFWAGKPIGRVSEQDALKLKFPTRVSAGLCTGSADLIGIKLEIIPVAQGHGEVEEVPVGRFVALEAKVGARKPTDQQKRFLQLIADLGGIAGVVRSTDDVDELLGQPPSPGD